jgi:hypothetical protein
LLTGAAYYLRKQFDSAISLSSLSTMHGLKEKDGYYKPSASKFDGNNAFSISTKEKTAYQEKYFLNRPAGMMLYLADKNTDRHGRIWRSCQPYHNPEK